MADLRAVAYLNHGRWVAMCPRPDCHSAEAFGMVLGIPGGLTGDTFRCRTEYGGCGLTCPADWPSNVADIEALVMSRRVPVTRNWLPGETLHDLFAENLIHGIVPVEALEGGPTRKLLQIVGDEVVLGHLASAERPEIERRRF